MTRRPVAVTRRAVAQRRTRHSASQARVRLLKPSRALWRVDGDRAAWRPGVEGKPNRRTFVPIALRLRKNAAAKRPAEGTPRLLHRLRQPHRAAAIAGAAAAGENAGIVGRGGGATVAIKRDRVLQIAHRGLEARAAL